MRTNNTECSICKKGLYRKPFEFKKVKAFCCKDCRSKLYKSNPNIWNVNLSKGRAWNKGLSKKNGDNLSYGKPRSELTKKLISDKLKQVLVKKGDIRNCKICDKEFYSFPSAIKRGVGIFCSIRCATLYKNMVQKDSDTDIEIIMENWLIEQNILYEKQKAIKGISVCDFFVSPNIIIYCDGDYWHNIPKVKQRDEWIDRQLLKNGYTVYRLKGSDIKKGVRPVEIL